MTLLSTAGPVAATLMAMAVVLGLIWAAQRAARLGGYARAPSATRALGVIETLPLDARRRLHLVGCDGRRVLLLTGGTADVVVGWLPDAADAANAANAT